MARYSIKYTATLPRPHQTWPLVKRFWPFMRPYKRKIVAIAVLLVLGLPVSMISPLLVKYLIDTVVAQRHTRQLFLVGAGLVSLTLFGQILSYWQTVLNSRFHLKVLYGMRRRLFAHLLRLPMSFYTQ